MEEFMNITSDYYDVGLNMPKILYTKVTTNLRHSPHELKLFLLILGMGRLYKYY
jgi:hypothetical protein